MNSFWTPERNAELRSRYSDEGATRIAEGWGVTKSTVAGRANRMGLSGPPGSRGRERVATPVVARPNPRGSCQWPHGDPREQDFHFCGARAAAGRPYCTEHVRMAYYRPGKEDAR